MTILKKKVAAYEEVPRGITELWERVQVEWERIDATKCQKLVKRLIRRMEEVIGPKGALQHTDLYQNL